MSAFTSCFARHPRSARRRAASRRVAALMALCLASPSAFAAMAGSDGAVGGGDASISSSGSLAQAMPFVGTQAPSVGAPRRLAPQAPAPAAKAAAPAGNAATAGSADPHTILPQPPAGKAAIGMSARFGSSLPQIPRGLVWRVFDDRPEASGAYPLVAEAADPAPVFFLSPGGYVVHVSYGLASVARRIVVGEDSRREQITIPAGGIKLQSDVGDKLIPASKVSYDIFEGSFLQGRAASRPFYRGAEPGSLVVLPAGDYYVVSTYGEGNAVLQADIVVQPGKVTDATLHHRAAEITLRLVAQAGGAPLSGTQWSVLTPGGDSIKDASVPTPNFVLAEGEYTALVRYDGKTFTKTFNVESGADTRVDVLVGEQAAAPEGSGD
ncbi:hypothetical protein LGR54_24340 [Ancylobacter sp. Lp-2]|uniref:hypothetical protein n=1 Tax=Ancylobacter sp. Lp-2 TaxID=2881339 RepID=UPI001E2AABB7|nr:hypothetical protein [Ancylobacter sp. Lp-2]MCB4771745.1 hypothetical protein [Ancylobacter sp. Lp-2]